MLSGERNLVVRLGLTLAAAFGLGMGVLGGNERNAPEGEAGPRSLPADALRRLKPTQAGRGGAVLAVAFAPDGHTLASAGMGATIHLWDGASGREVRQLDEKPHIVYALAFAPDGTTLASARHDGKISLWDLKQGTRRQVLEGHTGYVKTLAFAPEGRLLASGGVDETIRLWDTSTGKQVMRLHPDQGWLEALAFSPDGRVLASGSPYEPIQFWDIKLGREMGRLGQRDDGFLCLAFSPDGRTVAAAGKTTTIRLMERATGKVRARLEGHYDCVSSLAFAPDGRSLVSGSADRTVRVWDLALAKEVRRWQGHADAIFAIALAPDGKLLASASKDRTALLWDLQAANGERSNPGHVSARELRELWTTLAEEDAARAYHALWRLAGSPGEVVAFLAPRLEALSWKNRAEMLRLIARLDDDDFQERQRATEVLGKLGVEAEPVLRETLDREVSPEVRRRVGELLDSLQTPERARSDRQWDRALEVLEKIGTAEAREVVRVLARGTRQAPGSTVAAQGTLERMNRRDGGAR